MKTPRTLIAILAFTAASSGFAQQFAALPPLVSTQGSAEIRVVPDLADLSFEVEVRHVDLETARKTQAERAGKVLAALRAAGVAESELQSSQVQIAPNYTDNRQETDTVRFYRVTQTVSGTLHDVKKVPDVTAAAVSAGATGVRDAAFRTSVFRKHRDDARLRAVRAAREKAIALAAELGARIGRPYSISENSAPSWSGYNEGNIRFNAIKDAPAGEDGAPTFAPGTISISASVQVSFVLE